MQVVDDYATDSILDGHADLGFGLGIAVEIDFIHGKAGLGRGEQLSSGHHVEAYALGGDDAADVEGLQGLAGVERAGVGVAIQEVLPDLPQAIPDHSLGDDIERSTIFRRERDRVATVKLQVCHGQS